MSAGKFANSISITEDTDPENRYEYRTEWSVRVNQCKGCHFIRLNLNTKIITNHVVFWNVASCGSCRKRHFERTCRLRPFLRSVVLSASYC
jgi:hypothetical protein